MTFGCVIDLPKVPGRREIDQWVLVSDLSIKLHPHAHAYFGVAELIARIRKTHAFILWSL